MSRHFVLSIITFITLLFSGCATGTPPPVSVAPVPVASKTLSIRLSFLANPLTPSFSRNEQQGQGCSQSATTFTPHYFIAVNTSSQQIVQIDFSGGLPPSTWTDYLRYTGGAFYRNHRIAGEGQGQQFTGERQVTIGSMSGQTILFNISLPDNESVVGWGDPSQYFITAATYVSSNNDPQSLLRIDSMGARIAAGFTPENMLFNASISTSNTLADSGSTNDVVDYPIQLDACGFTAQDYNTLDITSLQVTLSQ